MLSFSRSVRLALGISALLGAALILGGCASGPVMISPAPPAKFERLGQATGTGNGSLGVVTAYFYFIPMGLNGRVQRAYDDAVASVPGATGLIDVTIKENWYWWFIGTARSVTITGEAIREVR